MALNAKQTRFVNEYLKDLNATQAAIRAGYSKKTAQVQSARLLSNVMVREFLSQKMQKRGEKTGITQEKVLERLWMIATANPNELVEYRRRCCRHCFGIDHLYQWKDEAEMFKSVAEASDPDSVTEEGGFGFDSTLRPHPKCPACYGEGFGSVHANDSRDVSPAALALYAGVKQTKEGFEIKMHDQLAALEKVAKHLGMFNDKLEQPIDEAMKKIDLERKKIELERLKAGGGTSMEEVLRELIGKLPG